ncbi:unnamed protein product [Meganyctiphanes norvegica]|uniref:Uncharacterized protein n=1 Tax=Meganyctiphanes norvegica TaxID=48144 RepID=A0AAV2PT42_MEGNR
MSRLNGLSGSAGMTSSSTGNNSSGVGIGGSQQHYCLRWNNHQHNLLGVLETVLTSQQYADVSLFCEGHVIRVHKLVLLASSSHFERILQASPESQQPVIILDGTRYADLRALVDYMYRGEVNIEQDQLSSLLKTAETLKIKGLADVANKEEDDGGGGGNKDNNRDRDRDESGGSNSPPPNKRPKASPVDPILIGRDSRGTDSSKEVRAELRDISPRDLPHFNIGVGGYPSSRLGPSPTPPPLPTSASLTPARSLLYPSALMSRPSSKSPGPALPAPHFFHSNLVRPRSPHPQYDPTAGTSLIPRSSQQSPLPDPKMVSQLGVPPFGLPFSLPLALHDSKKMLDRGPHKLPPPPHYDLDDKDRPPPQWPPRGASDLDLERERDREKGREREREREREIDQELERQRERETERVRLLELEREREKRQESDVQDQNSSTDPDRRHDDNDKSISPQDKDSLSPIEDSYSIGVKTELMPMGTEGEVADEDLENSEDKNGGNFEITRSLSTSSSGNASSGRATVRDAKGAELVKCPYCPRSYRHQNNLRTHIRCFHKGVRIPCPICHRGFTRWFTVRCHIAREHQNVDFSRPEALPAQLRRALYPPYPE